MRVNPAGRGKPSMAGPMRQNHAMAERVIPLVDQRIAALAAKVPAQAAAPTGLLTSLDTNRQLFLKYSSSVDFDPYSMSTSTLRSFFDEVMQNVRWLE